MMFTSSKATYAYLIMWFKKCFSTVKATSDNVASTFGAKPSNYMENMVCVQTVTSAVFTIKGNYFASKDPQRMKLDYVNPYELKSVG